MKKLAQGLAAAIPLAIAANALTPDQIGTLPSDDSPFALYESNTSVRVNIAGGPHRIAHTELTINDQCDITRAESHIPSRGNVPIPKEISDRDKEKVMEIAAATSGRLHDACI